jgi:PKD repeat protein
LTGRAVSSVVVENVNRPPQPDPGGPYVGVANVPIAFDGTRSSDPDGTELTSPTWDFGDLAAGSGLSPSHAYATGGIYPVTLTVGDGELTASASTTATVQSVLAARAFPDAQDRVIRLLAAKPKACLQVEPVEGSYQNEAVILASLKLISPGTGVVDEIPAIAGKGSISSDSDRNGVPEVAACFSKENLRLLFGRLPGGRQRVPVTLEGALSTGGILRASLSLDVIPEAEPLAATVSPSPMRGRGVFSIRTAQAGALSIRLFDTSGRLVRALPDVPLPAGGYRDITFDGRDSHGRELRSGVYFYRVEALEGAVTGRLVLVR